MDPGGPLHRVVIVGGGFAGLNAARELGRGRGVVEVVLLDRRNHHLFQPLLYQVATGALSPADIAAPLRHVLQRHRNIRVLLAEVRDLDVERKRVLLDRGELEYDTLIVATGSKPHYFGHDEWAQRATGLKDLEDATRIRASVLSAFERAEREQDAEHRRALMTFAIVGGGATGVELAGALAELARDTLKHEFRAIDPRDAHIVLVEAAERLLAAYPERLAESARRTLERLGVEVRTGTQVTELDDSLVKLRKGAEESTLHAATVLWAAGVRASEMGAKLAERAGATLDRQGRVLVAPDLSLPGHAEILVAGDLAHVEQPAGTPLVGVAPVAMQQGRYVGASVLARLAQRPVRPFHYRDKGNMAVIGRSAAVAEIAGRGFTGFPAWCLWLFIHLMYLVGFANRVLVLLQWAYNYWTRNRVARLIMDANESKRCDGRANRSFSAPE